MTTEQKLAHFLDTTVSTNTERCEAMLKSYQDSLDAQFKEHKDLMEQQAEAEIASSSESIRREGNRELAHSHLVLKRTLSQKTNELTTRLFDEVRSLLENYKKTPAYEELLASQIRSAREIADGEILNIYLDPADAAKQAALEKKTGCRLTVSRYSFGGGTRSVIPSRHILIDNSFDSRLEEQKAGFQFHTEVQI